MSRFNQLVNEIYTQLNERKECKPGFFWCPIDMKCLPEKKSRKNKRLKEGCGSQTPLGGIRVRVSKEGLMGSKSQPHKVKKGKGSYTRKSKHKKRLGENLDQVSQLSNMGVKDPSHEGSVLTGSKSRKVRNADHGKKIKKEIKVMKKLSRQCRKS